MWRRTLHDLVARAAPRRAARSFVGSASLAADTGDGRPSHHVPRSVASRYRGLRERPRIIHDIHEEEEQARAGTVPEQEPLWDPLDAWGSERGVTGVFDVRELVTVLRDEGLRDISVLRLPEQHAYVSHIVLATASSRQHMLTTAQFVKRLYKRKRHSSDPVPRIEGKDSQNWMALDLVNIALHMCDAETRALYDVDGLWAVGAQYDELSQPEESVQLLTTDPLADFRPWAADETGGSVAGT